MNNYKAMLDTDFLYKAHISRDKVANVLADRILEFDGYQFFYHEKIMKELSDPGFDPDPVPWLVKKTAEGSIKCYSDGDIIDLLANVFGEKAVSFYVEMLERSCNAFETGFFQAHYRELRLLPDKITKNVFLDTLRNCDAKIPNQNSMGEKKTFVLMQAMQLIYPGEVVVFCSDDGRARKNIAAVGSGVRCLSILSVFYKMMKAGMDKETVRPYFDSLCDFYRTNNQSAMKVWKAKNSEKIKVDFTGVFEDIFKDRFELLGTGDLKYLS